MKCPHCLVNFHVTERTTMNYSLTMAGHIRIHFIGKDVASTVLTSLVVAG